MSYTWPDGTEIEFFSPAEFDYPHLMDMGFVGDLSVLRMRCGFGIKPTNTVRLLHDMERIYKGPIETWPDSAHLYRKAGFYKLSESGRLMVACDADDPEAREFPEYKVRCADVKPASAATKQELEEKEMMIAFQMLRFWDEGRWPMHQYELATKHQHGDDYTWPGRVATRPNIFPGVSR